MHRLSLNGLPQATGNQTFFANQEFLWEIHLAHVKIFLRFAHDHVEMLFVGKIKRLRCPDIQGHDVGRRWEVILAGLHEVVFGLIAHLALAE